MEHGSLKLEAAVRTPGAGDCRGDGDGDLQERHVIDNTV